MDLRSYCSRCSGGAIALKNDPQGLCAVCRSKCQPDPAAQLAERDAIIDEALRLLDEAHYDGCRHFHTEDCHDPGGDCDCAEKDAALRARIKEARK